MATERAMIDPAERLKLGPKEGVTYPLVVQYCGNCTMPLEVSPDNITLKLNFFKLYLICCYFVSTVNTIPNSKNAELGLKNIFRANSNK